MTLAKLTVIVGLLTSCVGPGSDYNLPSADYDRFVADVQPLLAKECSSCHGANRGLPLAIYAVGESRQDRDAVDDDPLTQEELEFNYGRLMGLIEGIDKADDSPLLLMPLDVTAGGAPHHGIYYGAVGFEDKNAPGYRLMKRWIETAL